MLFRSTGSWPASKGASVAEPEQPAVVREVLAPSNFTVDAASFVKIFSLMIALTVAYGAPFKANGKKCKVCAFSLAL